MNQNSTIGLVHTYLYQSTDIKKVDTKSYLKILLQNMIENLTASNQNIELISDFFLLEVGKIIPLGLILSELAINSLVDHFKGSITFNRVPETTFIIHIPCRSTNTYQSYNITASKLNKPL